jgi:hypothetical protein
MQKASVPNEPPMSFWQFVWREVKQRITIGLLVLLVALFALPSLRPRPADWWDWIDALISCSRWGLPSLSGWVSCAALGRSTCPTA